MNPLTRRILASVLPLLLAGPAVAQAPGDPAPPPGVEVQPRGPVHEAFARPADVPPTGGPVVAAEPPALVPELPPEQKPGNPNAQWVPGYWSWDDEGNKYVWVSGCWRVPPPGRQWTAGSWQKAGTGWKWLPGYWAAAGAVQQLDQTPPPTLEVGPSAPPPSEDQFYTPGQWVFRDGNWYWQPGTWVENQPGMVYVPPAYQPSPYGNGYMSVPGYWDYPLDDRGQLFAPVTFAGSPWVGNPGWYYQPSYGVGMGGLLGSLFARPLYGSYYFGNYFGSSYRGMGYVPWAAYGGRGYDPLLNNYRWANRGNPGWYGNLSGLYAGRLNGTLPAPAIRYGGVVGYNPAVANRYPVNFGRTGTVTPVNSLRTVHHVGALNNATPIRPAPVVRSITPASYFPHPAQTAVPRTVAQPRVLAAPTAAPRQFSSSSFYNGRAAAPLSHMPQARAIHPQAAPYRGPAVHAAPVTHAAPRVFHAAPVAHSAPRMGSVSHGGGHGGGGHVGAGHGGGHHR
jgi:hypothetical protein